MSDVSEGMIDLGLLLFSSRTLIKNLSVKRFIINVTKD